MIRPLRQTLVLWLLSLRDLLVSAGPVLLLALGVLVAAYAWLDPQPPRQVTLATGPVVLAEELPLAPGVVERGGLHLLDCQRGALHALAQWEHCVARRGEPGSVERWFSLDDARVASRLPAALARALAWHWPGERPLEAATVMPWAMEVLARRVSAWRHPARHCADA